MSFIKRLLITHKFCSTLKHEKMKSRILTILCLGILLAQCTCPEAPKTNLASKYQVNTGKPTAVMLTSYSTTLIANNQDTARLRIAITDSTGKEIITATNPVQIYVTGNGKLVSPEGKDVSMKIDTAGNKYASYPIINGVLNLYFVSGNIPDKVKIEARSEKLFSGGTEIHTLPASFEYKKPSNKQLSSITKPIGRIVGADISFLPQIEDRGNKFFENGNPKDAVELLRNHGFNYIRLRIFVNPENEKGYAPGKGFCGLQATLDMAKRVKNAGMKILLDFHYSDYWADPQQQYKPLAWNNLNFNVLKDSVTQYTIRVLQAMQQQGTLPDMVQIGNEINHGILWPDGHIGNPDQLAELLKAGVAGVKQINKNIPIMMHLALGGQNKEATFWLDNMLARGVEFDLIGLSYYSRWHGTLDDLNANLNNLAKRYHKPLNVVEYSGFNREVHDIVFALPDGMGTGACIWEPLNRRSGMFNKNGEVTDAIKVYDELKKEYLEK
jgi:arabinogalactan endo-1,4-beta-galactosidase